MKVYDFNFLRRIFLYMTIVLVTFVIFIIILIAQLPKPEKPPTGRLPFPIKSKFELILQLAQNKNVSDKQFKQMLEKSGHGKLEYYKQDDIQNSFKLEINNEDYKIKPKHIFLAKKISTNKRYMFVRLENDKYLALEDPLEMKRRGPPRGHKKIDIAGIPLPVLILLSVVFVAIISILVSFIMLYIRLRIFSSKANVFISEIKKGNLSERFRLNKKEAFYETMIRFNTMASYIEDLFTNIKDSEEMRINVLQELSHDLRTPITSLKNLMETITAPDIKLSDAEKEEILELSKSEVLYFEKLVEDLLMWARINEPKYQENMQTINTKEILSGELKRLEKIHSSKKIILKSVDKDLFIDGQPQLIKRLFRNILENGIRFSRNQLEISIEIIGEVLAIYIQDDGEGFTNEAIENFGKKKFSRVSTFDDGDNLSIGLGSVIATSIVKLHNGKISVLNNNGGKVVIELPLK